MKRWMLFGAAGLAGIVLAFLLFPKPDTGTLPNAPVAKSPGDERPHPAGIGRPNLNRPEVPRTGPSPLAVENIKKMNLPDALYAGRITSPLLVIRRELSLKNDPAAEAIGAKIDPMIGTLREQRRDPASHNLPDLIAQSRAWLDEVKASQWAAEPTISAQFPRFDQIVAEYEQAKANPDAPVPAPGSVPTSPTTTAPGTVPPTGD
jgi:hypothetical protein